MRHTAAGAAFVILLALSWVALFSSFDLASGLAIIGLILAPFSIFVTGLPAVLRARDLPPDGR